MILIIFFLSTIWFIFQHRVCVGWDFAAYVLNAKYWFGERIYFEPLRPPLTPFIIGVFGSVFGWKASEYLYIILTSSIFLFSTLKLAKSLNLNRLCFYAISLNIYVLLTGLFVGTELLSFAFLQLFIAGLIEGKNSGHFLALSSLTRYNLLSMLPLLICYKKPRKIIKNFLLFFFVWLPWLIYNYFSYGNILASFFDNYLLNIKERQYMYQTFNPTHILLVTNFLTPFFFLSLFHFLLSLRRKPITLKFLLSKKIEFLMLLIFIITILLYINTPLKDPRFLFNLTLPVVYFSSIAYPFKKFRKSLMLFSITIFIFSLISSLLLSPQETDSCLQPYKAAVERIENLNLKNCSMMSNGWVYLNYLGQASKPSLRKELVLPLIQEGELILLFYHISEPEYTKNSTFIENLPIIYKDNRYVLIGNSRCKEKEIFDMSYLNQLAQIIQKIYNYSIDENYCKLIFDNDVLAKLCNLATYLKN